MPAPILSGTSVREVRTTSAVLGGIITSPGETVTARGVYIGPRRSVRNLINDGAKVQDVVAAAGTFEMKVSDLEPNTEYTFITYAVNDSDIGYSTSASTFKTKISVKSALARFASALARFAEVAATIRGMATAILLAIIWVVGYYFLRNTGADPIDFARGLITVLFASGTMALAFMLMASAIMAEDVKFEDRFSRGKEILTLLIGIFGTILGFYFGTASNPVKDLVLASLTANPAAITLKKDTPQPVTVNFDPGTGRLPKTVQLSTTTPVGVTAEFPNGSLIKISGTGTVTATAKVTTTLETATGTLQIIGTTDTGDKIGPLNIPVTVTK